jgi:hypothetical protein
MASTAGVDTQEAAGALQGAQIQGWYAQKLIAAAQSAADRMARLCSGSVSSTGSRSVLQEQLQCVCAAGAVSIDLDTLTGTTAIGQVTQLLGMAAAAGASHSWSIAVSLQQKVAHSGFLVLRVCLQP